MEAIPQSSMPPQGKLLPKAYIICSLSFCCLLNSIYNPFVLQFHVQIPILLLVSLSYIFTHKSAWNAEFCYCFFSCSYSRFFIFSSYKVVTLSH